MLSRCTPKFASLPKFKLDGKPYATTVAGIPNSARADGAFEGMKGSFFSGPEADEAILQIELAKDLSKTPDALIGKEITLRYAERQSLPADGMPAGQSGIPNAFAAPSKATPGKSAIGVGCGASPWQDFR